MTERFENGTALLATAFGASLLTAGTVARSSGTFDARTARELAVLSRVLERRLGEMRRAIMGHSAMQHSKGGIDHDG